MAGAVTDGLPGALWAQTLDTREFEVLVDDCSEGDTQKVNRMVDCGEPDLAWRVEEPGYRNVFVPEALAWHWMLQGQLCRPQLPKLAAQIGFLAARQAAICAGMIYGSVRFRTVVL